jgi:capsular exopolysaccharide synthesis family protein
VELREVVRALRSAWWLLAVGLLLGAGAAAALSLVRVPLYTSNLQLFVSTPASGSTAEAFQGNQLSQQRVGAYARLITGEELAGRVIDRLGLDVSALELTGRVEASATPDTVLIDVSVSDPSPRRAQRIAAAIGDEFPRFVGELEPPGLTGESPVRVTVADPPNVASAPTSPKVSRDVGLGALLGLLVGAGLAVLRARLDRSVKDQDEAAEAAGAPVIGTVLRDDSLLKHHTIDRARGSRTAEDYRQLRTNLQFLNVDNPPRVIMVSSAVPSEGKTTLVVNLGLALADAGHSVTLVEADLRRPKVTRYMGLVGGVGLTNVLAGAASLDEVRQAYGGGDVSVIAAGPTPPNPGEMLASSHMAAVIEKLRGESDFVLVDAPPLLPVADSSGLAVLMDGVLLSVRYGSTTTEQLRQAGTTLDRVGAKTLGVILNIVPPKAELASAYGYGYGYGYGEEVRGSERAK